MQEINDSTFSRVEQAHGAAIAAFYATWCPHCHRMMPIWAELEKKYGAKLQFFTIDVDKAPQSSARYGVRGIPTMVFLKDGQEQSQLSGERRLQELEFELAKLF